MGVPCNINGIHSFYTWLECTESLLFQVYRSEGQSVRYKNESVLHYPKSVSKTENCDAIPAIFIPELGSEAASRNILRNMLYKFCTNK